MTSLQEAEVLPDHMAAAVYHGPGEIRAEQVPTPSPAAGELLVRVEATGVCGSDAAEWAHGPHLVPLADTHAVTGHRGPVVLGHELAGTVVAVGPGTSVDWLGARVASGAGISCGECPACAAGRTNLCERYATVGFHRDGGLAQYVTVPASCTARVPGGMSADLAALAQPLSVALHAARRGALEPGAQVVIHGVGGIGVFLTFAAARLGARVSVVEPDDARRRLALTLGAVAAVPPDQAGTLPRPSVAFEVTGIPDVLRAAIRSVAAGGRVVLVGLPAADVSIDVRAVTLGELDLVGTMAHAFAADFQDALAMLALDPETWQVVAPEAIPLDAVVAEGLEPLAGKHASRIKTLVDPWTSDVRPTRMALA